MGRDNETSVEGEMGLPQQQAMSGSRGGRFEMLLSPIPPPLDVPWRPMYTAAMSNIARARLASRYYYYRPALRGVGWPYTRA